MVLHLTPLPVAAWPNLSKPNVGSSVGAGCCGEMPFHFSGNAKIHSKFLEEKIQWERERNTFFH
ncbi:hypothetical protein M5K25_016573 [Dendrobium thyrsiflorum]|uniref:Uncharacterized protein n=1 Tax=Dendrobium thyrsiflorum TaxID=117978 RepID=A0ABD0USB6_DENTH